MAYEEQKQLETKLNTNNAKERICMADWCATECIFKCNYY